MKLRNGAAASAVAFAAMGVLAPPAHAGPSDPAGQECVTATLDASGSGSETGRTDVIRFLANALNPSTPAGYVDYVAAVSLDRSYTIATLTGTQKTLGSNPVTSPFVGAVDPEDPSRIQYQAPDGEVIATATATACKTVVTPPPSGGGGGGGAPGTGAGKTPPPASGSGASSGTKVSSQAPRSTAPKVEHQVPVGQQHGGRYDSSWSATQWAGLSLIGTALVGSAGFVERRRRSGRG